MMGRKRLSNFDLPKHSVFSRGSYFYMYDKKWTALGPLKDVAISQANLFNRARAEGTIKAALAGYTYQRDYFARGLVGNTEFRCAYCWAETDLEADHFIPRGRGGANTPANLVLACSGCNWKKRDQHPLAFLADLQGLLAQIRPKSDRI